MYKIPKIIQSLKIPKLQKPKNKYTQKQNYKKYT